MPLTFGVEIEFICARSRPDIAAAVTAAGVSCVDVGYTHNRNPSWKIVTDGSIGVNGNELVSPVLTSEHLGEIDRVCAVLSGLGATVNRQCGLHVHVGAANLGVSALKRLAALYAESEDVIDQLLPPSRRASNNTYCRTLKSIDVRRLAGASDVTAIAQAVSMGERYSKLNYASYWRHGTVEFRQHSGTVDPEKIKNWVLFCLKMVETAKREEGGALRAEAVAAPSAVPTNLAAYSPNPFWRRGRRTRMVFQMLSQPEGATAEEIRVALGVQGAPDIPWHLARAREQGSADYTRARVRQRGGVVFRLVRASMPVPVPNPTGTTPAPQLTPITTLDALLAKLQMTPTERTYWVERQAMLSPSHE